MVVHLEPAMLARSEFLPTDGGFFWRACSQDEETRDIGRRFFGALLQMAQKKDGGESTASKTKSNKSTKKTSKSKETVHKPVIKSSEIIVDSDAESEIQVGAPVDDSEKNAPKESVSNKSRSSPNDKTQEPKRPLGESNEDGDGFSTTKSREKSQTSANHEDRQVQRKGGVENSDNVPNQSRQGLKLVLMT